MVRGAADIGEHVHTKEGVANFVTDYDVAVENYLYEKLAGLLPEARFIGEESDENHSELLEGGLSFIIDPIDGTTNFIRGMRHSAISVALCDRGEIVAGVVSNPYLNEIFTADKGRGAFVNGRPIRVSGRPLNNGLVSFGTTPYRREYADRTFSLIRALYDRAGDIRRRGAAALDLCDIASGRSDAFVELLLSPWDYAAGTLLVTEAGGKITDFDGRPIGFAAASSVIAGGSAAYDEAFAVLTELKKTWA